MFSEKRLRAIGKQHVRTNIAGLLRKGDLFFDGRCIIEDVINVEALAEVYRITDFHRHTTAIAIAFKGLNIVGYPQRPAALNPAHYYFPYANTTHLGVDIALFEPIPYPTLHALLNTTSTITVDEINWLMVSLLERTQALHHQNIVHGAINLKNIHIIPKGVALGGVGIEFKANPNANIPIEYIHVLAPELLFDERLDTGTDIYAIGQIAVLLSPELSKGHQAQGAIITPAIFTKMTSSDPKIRYSSIDLLIQDIKRLSRA